jgi:tetratricopeptide (TPR) repeat protein
MFLHWLVPASPAADCVAGVTELQSRWGAIGLCFFAAVGGVNPAWSADGALVAGLDRALAAEEHRSGDASPQLLPLLDRLAGAQFDDGALANAAASRGRALKIAIAAYGSGSPNAAKAMTALAEIDIMRLRYLDAEPLLTVAVSVLGERLGDQNPVLSAPLAALARVALARGDFTAAEGLAKRAEALAAHDPAQLSEALRVLGAAYAGEERFDEGETVLRRALDQDRHRHGDTSVEAARSLAQLANLLLRAKRFDEALPLEEQALAIDQSRLGPTHPLIADDLCDLGLIYSGLKRDAEAGRVLVYAIGLLEQGGGNDSTRLGYAELDLAGVLDAMGYNDAADAIFADAKRIIDKIDKDDHDREREG